MSAVSPPELAYTLTERREDISPADIQSLRESVGWQADSQEVWQVTLDTALSVRAVFVGIGFLVGSPRHAVLCDVCVKPAYQSRGLGGKLVASLVEDAKRKKLRYITLTFDANAPWLKDWYGKHGFRVAGNAMRLP